MGGRDTFVAASTRVIYSKLRIFSVFNELVRAFDRCVGCGHALAPEHLPWLLACDGDFELVPIPTMLYGVGLNNNYILV